MTTRNSNAHFSLAPQAQIERSTFDRSTNVKTSFDVGELIPFYVDEVLPGDTFRIKTSKVMRLQTLITPVMDNLYLDTYYFFVPNRLVWEHWEDFISGGSAPSNWTTPANYSVPIVIPPYVSSEEGVQNGWACGTIADYMGVPINVYDADEQKGINALPFRAYAQIVNDWFRDENLDTELYINKGDSATSGSNGGDYPSDCAAGGKPFIANKYHDYFTSCLPKPQKGPDVPFLDGFARVYPHYTDNQGFTAYIPDGTVAAMIARETSSPHSQPGTMTQIGVYSNSSLNLNTVAGESPTNKGNFYVDNLFADLSTAMNIKGYSTTSINTLRQAFQIQRLLERDARGGTRYIELLKAHFGVTSPDSRLQRAEYLGGNRVPFNIEQVLQTSSTDSTTPQGNVAGWSQTNDFSYDVEKSFVEHGFIIGLMCARYDHSYQEGLERQFFRSGRFDYYWPVLAHLGEKAVFNAEICWDGVNHVTTPDNYGVGIVDELEVFGYQEAWAEYRYKPNYVTGQMRSSYAQSLDFWHFADYYDVAGALGSAQLSSSWMKEDKNNVDRCLAVSSELANQIFGDIYVDVKATRPMPLYSIPGMIDHF